MLARALNCTTGWHGQADIITDIRQYAASIVCTKDTVLKSKNFYYSNPKIHADLLINVHVCTVERVLIAIV